MDILQIVGYITIVFSILFAGTAIFARIKRFSFPRALLVINYILLDILFIIYIIGSNYEDIKALFVTLPSGTIPENVNSFLLSLTFGDTAIIILSFAFLFIAEGITKGVLGFNTIRLSTVISCAAFYGFAHFANNAQQINDWFILLVICAVSYAVSTIVAAIVRKVYMAKYDKGYDSYKNDTTVK